MFLETIPPLEDLSDDSGDCRPISVFKIVEFRNMLELVSVNIASRIASSPHKPSVRKWASDAVT